MKFTIILSGKTDPFLTLPLLIRWLSDLIDLISQETPDSLPNVLEYGRVCNWCLHFILPEQLRTKINKIIVRQIHEE
jgi:hypothetical protein